MASFPSHTREGKEGCPAPSLSPYRSVEADTRAQVAHWTSLDSRCGQGALLLLMQMGFPPNVLGGAEQAHSFLRPSDTRPPGVEGCLPPGEWEWSLPM